MFSNLGVSEILIIAVVALLVFGPNKMPELLKSFGKGMREFKRAMNEVENEIKESISEETKKKDSPKQ